jgi:GDPmannose 4,6-dehydratase
MTKTAFITGITGQDGAYLAEFLQGKGYAVHGLVRYDAQNDTAHLKNVTLHYGDMTDANNLNAIIKHIKPDEIYNLAALSHVKVSFETPASALDINIQGTLNILEAVRILDMEETARIYQASSSEMFGTSPPPQNEDTPMHPASPYGASKLAAYWLARTYREAYGLHVSNGILFNHESPMRGEEFVTRKIARAVAEIEAGRLQPLALGNLNAVRDWGFAGDYVRGMWMMLQQDEPDDYVLATGTAHSVREFTQAAFACVGIQINWRGQGLQERGVDTVSGRTLVEVDPALFRHAEVHHLLGDASKARAKLGWAPTTNFETLVGMMVNAERGWMRTKEPQWLMAG